MKHRKVAGIILLEEESVKRLFHPIILEFFYSLMFSLVFLGLAGYSYYYNLYLDYYAPYICAGFGVLLLFRILYKIFTNTFIITSDRVLYIKGLFNIEIVEVSLDKITNIAIDQSFFQQIFNFGDVSIDTASGTVGYEIVMKGIGEPKEVQLLMKNLLVKKETRVLSTYEDKIKPKASEPEKR
ncbi:Bacterial PH domain protein [Candidatus Tiddalikarchaeum anstoanum]|nr:Bacterial PH domain protein [Candidatus Tiddalikarchaeum anstoanum]